LIPREAERAHHDIDAADGVAELAEIREIGEDGAVEAGVRVLERPPADGEDRRDPGVQQSLADDRVTDDPGGPENESSHLPQSRSAATVS
jgi:hypothetical protein